ncbi:hypothetical protein G7Y89_g9479 [Cudoniella acicularis]|uniref:Uncharacterized protein n=1 Tax=Cudoniella acicularis TaxID=354080 RepID=A0A8H4W004_9HELO|nr:hypothetical protein G7Y89_g9479 [Cudoniella acicularis]
MRPETPSSYEHGNNAYGRTRPWSEPLDPANERKVSAYVDKSRTTPQTQGFKYAHRSSLYTWELWRLEMLNKFCYRIVYVSIITLVIWNFSLGNRAHILWRWFTSINKDIPSSNLDRYPISAGTEAHEGHSALTALCSRANWTDGLWLQCHSYSGKDRISVAGGLNNARNRIQTCIRLAIDAGSGLIIPPISTIRDSTNWVTGQTESVCADLYWNMEQLQVLLHEECPQLQLRHCGGSSGIDTIIPTVYRHYSDPPGQHGTLKALVETALSESNISKISSNNPVAVSFGDDLYAFNYSAAGEMATVRKDLFRLLNFNQHLLDISTTILESHQLRYGYIGVHFRGEKDWLKEWGTAVQQMEYFLKEIREIEAASTRGIRTIYVSCGSQEAIAQFREKFTPFGYMVIDKWSILAENPPLLEEVNAMDFDRQAVVDYGVLLGADYFEGLMMSTMSLLVAYARTMDEEEDFFSTYVLAGSRRIPNRERLWDVNEVPAMKGHSSTKLFVLNNTFDNFDSVP